jgi:lysophospholipase L1-like esterase
MSAVQRLVDDLRKIQRALVSELQAASFCDDLEPPAGAFGWTADQFIEFFESGGGAAEPAPPAKALRPPRPALLLIGDSQTDIGSHVDDSSLGWVSLLTRDYQAGRSMDVVNRGFSGYNSRFVRDELPSILHGLPATLAGAVVLLGTNDCCRPDRPGRLQHVPVPEYEENLTAIVRETRAALVPDGRLILLTPAPLDGERFEAEFLKPMGLPVDGRSEETLAPYVEAARRVARVARCELVDLHSEWASARLGASQGLADGAHFDAKGHQLMHRLVAAKLRDVGLGPEALRSHLPHWLHVARPQHIDWDGKKLF